MCACVLQVILGLIFDNIMTSSIDTLAYSSVSLSVYCFKIWLASISPLGDAKENSDVQLKD